MRTDQSILLRFLIQGVLTILYLLAPEITTAGVVLFTASTDNTGGAFPVSVPGTNNPNIPTIDPAVTLAPNPALLDGTITGPLGGVTYGPVGFGANGGGNTGWVSISYTVTTSGLYQLIWEVAGADPKIGSAITIDNVRVDNNVLFDFSSGIPGGFVPKGTVGTSGAVPVTDASHNPLPDFGPTQGSQFAYMDISGGVTPIYDTVDPYLGSRLYSSLFSLSAGDTLTMDMAFLTNEGSPFFDYGIATLNVVPEPAALVIASISFLVLGATRLTIGKSAP
jgi:hypothetical protein